MTYQKFSRRVPCAVIFVLMLWASAAEAQITGGGTGGRISKFTGTGPSTNIGDSVLFESGGFLGLGTTTPGYPLHINSSSASPLMLKTSTAGMTLSMKDNTTTATYGQAIARIGDMLDLRTMDHARLVIREDGCVGIGYELYNPQAYLHVHSGSRGDTVLFQSSTPGMTLNMKDTSTTSSGQALARIGDDLELRTMDTPRLTVAADGKVVITPTGWAIVPTHQLTVDADTPVGATWATGDGNAQLVLRGNTNQALRVAVGVDTTNSKGRIQAVSAPTTAMDLLLQPAGGNVGIGCTTTTQKLQVAGTIYSTSGGFKFPDGTTQTTAATGSGSGWTDSGTNVILATSTDKVGIGTSSPGQKLTVRGNIRIERTSSPYVAVLELGDGLDYAEGFDVAGSDKPQPGTVLVIDSSHPGRLTTSTKAYDTTVAGIAAGANNLGSGVRLGVGDFDCDVSLAGRVYCNVDATECAVQPGDLLTTSNIAGYAMKAADRARTSGAVLGKAMQSLEQGKKGQILVLVTLQ